MYKRSKIITLCRRTARVYLPKIKDLISANKVIKHRRRDTEKISLGGDVTVQQPRPTRAISDTENIKYLYELLEDRR